MKSLPLMLNLKKFPAWSGWWTDGAGLEIGAGDRCDLHLAVRPMPLWSPTGANSRSQVQLRSGSEIRLPQTMLRRVWKPCASMQHATDPANALASAQCLA